MAENDFKLSMKPFVGSSASEDGKSGKVPQPLVGDEIKFLKGDGTWDYIKPDVYSDVPNANLLYDNQVIAIEESTNNTWKLYKKVDDEVKELSLSKAESSVNDKNGNDILNTYLNKKVGDVLGANAIIREYYDSTVTTGKDDRFCYRIISGGKSINGYRIILGDNYRSYSTFGDKDEVDSSGNSYFPSIELYGKKVKIMTNDGFEVYDYNDFKVVGTPSPLFSIANSSINVNASTTITKNIFPIASNSYNIGSSTLNFKNIYGLTFYENGVSLENKYLGLHDKADDSLKADKATKDGDGNVIKDTYISDVAYQEGDYINFLNKSGDIVKSVEIDYVNNAIKAEKATNVIDYDGNISGKFYMSSGKLNAGCEGDYGIVSRKKNLWSGDVNIGSESNGGIVIGGTISDSLYGKKLEIIIMEDATMKFITGSIFVDLSNINSGSHCYEKNDTHIEETSLYTVQCGIRYNGTTLSGYCRLISRAYSDGTITKTSRSCHVLAINEIIE